MSPPGSKGRRGSRALPLLCPKALVLLLSGSFLGGNGGMWAQAQILADNATPEGSRCSIGLLGQRCPTGYFCLFRTTGSCGGFSSTSGVCSRFPEACPAVYQPVCGCDSNTYATDCHAYSAGLSIKSLGECPRSFMSSLFGLGASPTPSPTSPLSLPLRTPVPSAPRLVAPAPTLKPTVKPTVKATPRPTPAPTPRPALPISLPKAPLPVDNDYDDVFKLPGDKSLASPTTTSSTTSTDKSLLGRTSSLFGGKTSIFMDRLSNKATACTSSSMCGSGQFCHFTLASNSLIDACPTLPSLNDATPAQSNVVGTCETRPDACIEIFKPVCGCDGKTYQNDCLAHQSGMSVRRSGACAAPPKPDNKPKPPTNKTSCGGFRGVGCPEGSYCNYADQSCGAADQTGVCEAVGSGMCPKLLKPVCGCDGLTYSTACVAEAAGVSLADKNNACPMPTTEACGGDAGSCQDKAHFCQYTLGVCGRYKQQGLCAARPSRCVSTVLPVCGCDGVTYKNQCFATLAGVSVATIGECPALASGGSKGPTIPLLKSLQDAAAKSTEERKDGGRLNESAAVAMAFFGDHAKLSHTQGGNSSSLPPEPSSTLAYANSMLQLMAQAGGTNDTCGADQGGCPSGYYCAYPQGQCGAAHTAGVCMSVPTACESFAPLEVCGCDGQTYRSECHAAASKVTVKSPFQSCEALRAATQAGATSPASALAPHTPGRAALALGLAMAWAWGAY